MTAAAVTLCFLLRTNNGREEVLLGLKKTGFGTGKIVGIGGHVEPGESTEEAICREVEEECSLRVEPADLIQAGIIDFVFPANPGWDMHTTAYLCRVFAGQAQESAEISPEWFALDDLPLERMWQDAQHWLPQILSGEKGAWRIVLDRDNESVASATHTPFHL